MNQYSADESATKNVTADRNVYAAYKAVGQVYTVYFYNGSTLLQTVTGVPYGGSTSYTGETPVYTGSNPDDYRFTGWSPQPTNITGTTSCYAVYAYTGLTETITDSWEEILAAVANGTYKTKYQVGDTKILDVGSEGSVCMQIAAFDADTLADGTGKAPISWISEQLLITSKRMNPALVSIGGTFIKQSGSNTWKSSNQGGHSSTCTSTFTIVASADGTLTVNSAVDSEGSDRLTVKIDGSAVVNAVGGTGKSFSNSVECTTGQTVTVVASYSKDGSVNTGSDTATISFDSTMDISITATTPEVTGGITSGTGSIGGWEKSEMRAYLNDSVKPQIPALVRAAIKPVSKTHPAYSDTGNSYTQTTTDEVWIPSYNEMFGSSSLYYPLFQNTNANRIKKKAGATSASWWWLRSAGGNNYFDFVSSNGYDNSYNANSSGGVALGFCT